MLILHISAETRAALLVRKVMALKKRPYGLFEGTAALNVGGEQSVALQWGRRVYLGPVLAVIAVDAAWPDPTLFPNGNRGMPLALDFWSAAASARAAQNRAALLAHAALIARQLTDGRTFLQGDEPGLADAEAWSFLAFCDYDAAPGSVLAAWQARMSALGSGSACGVSVQEAAGLASDPESQTLELGALARKSEILDPGFGRLELAEPLL